jgi:hypothetical protein
VFPAGVALFIGGLIVLGAFVATRRRRADVRFARHAATAMALLTPDDDFWTTETADEQWLRDELNMTRQMRMAQIDYLDSLVGSPPVIRGRQDQ